MAVDELPVVDLRDPATRAALGVTVEELIAARTAPQELARRLVSLGALGAVVPSAAHAGHWNLVVFPLGFAHLRVSRGQTVHPAPPGAPLSAGG